MNNDDNDMLNVIKYCATTPLFDIKKNRETKKQMINRLENFLLDKFSSLMKVTIKRQNSSQIVIVILLDTTQHQELLNTAFDDLKTAVGADTPTFYNYDPAAILAEERTRTLNI